MNSLLVVDDEPGIRTLVSRWAEASGYSVQQAGCAGEALDQMAAHPAAIALCDVTMPDRDGFWLAAQLKQQFPTTAVIIVSGFSDSEPDLAADKGAMGYLGKPFGREQLIDVLKRASDWHMAKVTAMTRGYATPSSSSLPIRCSSKRR
jgi:CheY-like chemotaxis protein